MKLFTIVLSFTLLALSAADYYCSEKTLKECVSIKKCPIVSNIASRPGQSVVDDRILEFLHYVKDNYYCKCRTNDGEPAIKCPDKFPERFDQLVVKDPTDFEKPVKKCVSIKTCPIIWNKVEELNRLDTNKHLLEFLKYVEYSYYCDYQVHETEPAIECPDELPEKFSLLVPEKLISKDEKKKELLEVCGTTHTDRMSVDGNSTDLTDYPWLALLRFENSVTGKRKFLCGGVLITDRHVLTAAHCVTSPSNKLISVRLGEYDTTVSPSCIPNGQGGKRCKASPKDVEVAEWVIHEGYNNGPSHRRGGSGVPSDLAIVRLKTKVQFDEDVRPICLPQKNELLKQQYEVAGWSTTMAPSAMTLPQKLRSTITRISSEKCLTYPVNRDYTDSDHICAGGTSGQACIADVGGPLMAQETKEDGVSRMTVFGITFMELPCSMIDANLPGVFTKVHKYLPWIEERIL